MSSDGAPRAKEMVSAMPRGYGVSRPRECPARPRRLGVLAPSRKESAMSITLSEGLADRIVRPDDPGYDEARAIHNGLVDKRPALIVRCRGAEDVVAALALARDSGLEVSVRGGGHNVAGRAVADGGLMIDLAEMRAIAVDPGRHTATAGGGATW